MTSNKLTPWRTALLSIALGALTISVYWPVLSHQFVNLDDPQYVLTNPIVRHGFNWHNFAVTFRVALAGNWHPLTWLSHMLDVQLFGLNPAGHHLISLLFHVANSILLLLLLQQLTGAPWRSATVAALFALHPLHVESVAWIAERKDVLSAFFFFLTILAYAAYVKSKVQSANFKVGSSKLEVRISPSSYLPTSIFYLLSLALFVLGLMSKPMLVTLPFLLLLLDYWPLGGISPLREHGLVTPKRSEDGTRNTEHAPLITDHRLLITSPKLLLEKLPFFALSAACCIITVLAQRTENAVTTLSSLPFGLRLENAVVSYATYLQKTFWPAGLGAYYPFPESFPYWQVAISALFLLLLTTLALLTLKTRTYLAVGWFWFLGMLVPVIGLVQVGLQARADRYTYLPLIGIFIATTWAAADFMASNRRTQSPGLPAAANPPTKPGPVRSADIPVCSDGELSEATNLAQRRRAPALAAAVAMLFLLACALLSRRQLGFWRDSETLYRHTLAVTTNNFFVHQNLGTWLLGLDRYDEALQQFAAAIRLQPNLADSYGAAGMALARQGKSSEVIPLERKSIQLNPRLTQSHYLLASALMSQRQYDEAIAEYKTVLDQDPIFAPAYNDLAWLLATAPDANLRSGTQAVTLALRGCQLTQFREPLFIGTLAAAYAETGQFDDAIQSAEKAKHLALAAGNKRLAERNDQLLGYYRARKPYHETIPSQ